MRGRFRPHNVVKGFKKFYFVFLYTHFLRLPACAIFFCYFIVYEGAAIPPLIFLLIVTMHSGKS